MSAAPILDQAPEPGAADLCAQLWARGIALYPDLRAGRGVGVVSPQGADYADLLPLLVLQRDGIYRYLCDSLTPQDACELAAFNGFAAGAIAAMLRRIVARRGLSAAVWTDAFTAQMAAHAIEQTDRYPEEYARLGRRRDARAPAIPFDEEVAASLFAAGASWEQVLAALRARRDAWRLPAGDEDMEEHTQGGYWLLYGRMGGATFAQHRLRILRRDGDGYSA